MFTEKQLENYAKALIWGVTNSRKGEFEADDYILVRGHLDTIPLIEIIYRELIKKEFNPVVKVLPTETMEVDYYKYASDKQLESIYPWWSDEYEHVKGSIAILGQTSLVHLADVPPEKQAKSALAVKPVRQYLQKKELEGLFGWTLGTWPQQCNADEAGVTLAEYTEQLVKAVYLDSDDIEGDWTATDNGIKHIIAELDKTVDNVDYYHMVSENTDLKVTPGESRKFVGGGGCNIPSFEIFTSPDWKGTEGTFYADQPSFHQGNLVKGVRLVFKEGLVVDASAEEGEAHLIATLDTDEDARKVGEFSLTDTRHSKIDRFMADTLFDENFGGDHGNCHIAVGCAYPETYSGDHADLTDERKKELGFTDSAVHWDLINTEPKTVTAVMKDGSELVIYKNGQFTV